MSIYPTLESPFIRLYILGEFPLGTSPRYDVAGRRHLLFYPLSYLHRLQVERLRIIQIKEETPVIFLPRLLGYETALI